MIYADKISHNILVDWSSKILGEGPEFEGELAKISFSFYASGHYPIECLLLAQEPRSILTISASVKLAIPDEKRDRIIDFCAEKNDAAGLFNVVGGVLVYIHSRSVESKGVEEDLCSTMLQQADAAFGSVAEGVLAILKT